MTNAEDLLRAYVNRAEASAEDAAAIDALTGVLDREFRECVTKVKALDPTMDDERELFRCWCLQRLAALLFLALRQADEIQGLRDADSAS